jgi:hypothetical protein
MTAKYLLACKDDPEFRSMGQVQLLQHSMTPGQVAGSTPGTNQGLCHQVVVSVNI